MPDNSPSMAAFVDSLHDRVKGLNVDDISDLISLLQQDRRGQVKAFTEKQIGIIMSNCLYSDAKCKISEETMVDLLNKLQDPKRMSIMHHIGRKQLQLFIVQLSKRQTAELVQHMAPFFAKYTQQFVESLSVDQKAEVFADIMPCALSWAREQGAVASLLAALYEPPDIATAIEFYGHNQKISEGSKAAHGGSSSSRSKHSRDKKGKRAKKTHPAPVPEQPPTTWADSDAPADNDDRSDSDSDSAEIQPQESATAV